MSGSGRDRQASGVPARPVTYCVVPRDLVSLHEALRRHFQEDPSVEVIVERRASDRRGGEDRRAAGGTPRVRGRPGARDRRTIHNVEGRRVGDRRAALVPVDAPALPRRARRHADRLVFVERLEPHGEHAEDLDTARLVTRFQAGDREAFSILYQRYFDRVYNYLRLLLKQTEDAEDGTQQVFAQVLEALPRYEQRRRPFRGWLFVVVRNYALQQLQRRWRIDTLEPREMAERQERAGLLDEGPPVPDWITDRELLLFVERLPVAQREVLLLRYMMDLSTAEAARALGRTPDSVRKLQSRAIAFLRKRLIAVGRGPERGERTSGVAYRRQATVVRARRFQLVFRGPTR